jgi:bla regulator protein blaR1
MNDIPSLVYTQIWQVSLFFIVFGLLARWLMPMRPRLAQGILIVLIVKSCIPPLIPGPFTAWTTPLRSDTSRTTNQHEGRFLGILSARAADDPKNLVPSEQPLAVQVEPPQMTRMPKATGGTPYAWPMQLAFVIWSFGAIVTMAIFWRRYRALTKVLRHGNAEGSEIQARLQARCNEIKDSLAIPFPVRVILNDASLGPMAMRFREAILLFPSCFVAESTREELDLALTHELLHLRRGDTWLAPIQVVAHVIWWFHPLVWWVNHLLDRCCELICDDEVVRVAQCGAAKYARFLLEFSDRKHLKHIFPLPAARPLSVTAQRITSLVIRQKAPHHPRP